MQFQLKIIDATGNVSHLTLEGESEAHVLNSSALNGFVILEIRSLKTIQQALKLPTLGSASFDILLFSEELVVLLKAGLNLISALETLYEKNSNPVTQKIIGDLLLTIKEGKPFSHALTKHPQEFSALYVALIQSSEQTGSMAIAIERFVRYKSQMEFVKNKIITASIYPVLIMVVGVCVSLFLLGYVVPKFSGVFEDAKTDLPFLSKMLIDWGKLIESHGQVAVLILFASLIFIWQLIKHPKTRALFASKAWETPKIGEYLRIYELARFYRTLGMLLQSGIPHVQALKMSADTLGARTKALITSAVTSIEVGKPLSEAFKSSGLSTPVSARMMIVGEQAGNMGEMLEKSAEFYEAEISRKVDWLTRLIEPVLMILIGLMIGGIVILMYIPIFELADSIH